MGAGSGIALGMSGVRPGGVRIAVRRLAVRRLAGVGLAGMALLALGAVSCGKPGSEVVARVDSEPVTVSELRHFMLLEKAAVYSAFHRRYGVAFDAGFWETELGGEVPLDVLKGRALDEAVRFKTEQLLAREAGLEVQTHFDSLMQERLRVNARRRRVVDNGGVVYGPVELSERLYVRKVRDAWVQQTKDRLGEGRFKMPEALMRQEHAAYAREVESSGEGGEPAELSAFASIRQNEYTASGYESLVGERMRLAVIEIDSLVFGRVGLP